MLINIVLSACVFAVIGSIAHRIVGGSGGVLHNAFVGFAGYALADIVCRVIGVYPYGVIINLLLAVAGACVFILFLNAVKKRCQNESEN